MKDTATKNTAEQNHTGKLMAPAWTGIALLSLSWLFSLSYFSSSHWAVWAFMTGVGALCLGGEPEIIPAQKAAPAAILLLVPCVIFAQWPYRLSPLLLVLGLLMLILPIQGWKHRRLGSGFIIAGTVLLAQALILQIYMNVTSRSHELPYIFSKLLERVVTLLGIDAAAQGSNLAVFSMRKTHNIGVTWELLLDPASLSFLIGGLVLIFLRFRGCSSKNRSVKQMARHFLGLVVPIILWLPMRAGFMLSVYLHRVLLTDYDKPLHLMAQFWNPWLHSALLAVPVLLAVRFVNVPVNVQKPPVKNEPTPLELNESKLFSAASLFFAGCLALTVALYWYPQGTGKAGRILVDEYHSQTPWTGKDFDTTRTDKPFDTEWYGHDSSYNYACIYDYCTRFYEMSRLFGEINDESLRNTDVLVLKVPSIPYSDDETASVRRFVEKGGGLMLMGEHTNVFGSGVYLNRIAETFGFEFRYDCLFGIDSVFKQSYYPPKIPHPIIRNLPLLDFAISCSIAPGISAGQAVIRATGLKSLGADYHASNFYPQAVDQPEMRYGAFVQLWATRHGSGRVAAFTDSTIFANFSAFEPGKSELMLGMLEWLNHRNGVFPKGLLAIIGIIFFSTGLVLTPGRKETWLIMLAAGMFGWTVAGFSVNSLGMELPKAKRPMVRVAIERSISGASLPEGGFISGKKDRFGQFERSILRLGYFPYRANPDQNFDGDFLIILYPDQKPDPKFVEKLDDYVNSGGKVLILDSPENVSSTANELLHPFGLTVKRRDDLKGALKASSNLPQIEVTAAMEVSGGNTIASLADRPVAATIYKGKGSVTVIGFGSRFSDANMGVIADVIPDTELRRVFDFEFAILRAINRASR